MDTASTGKTWADEVEETISAKRSAPPPPQEALVNGPERETVPFMAFIGSSLERGRISSEDWEEVLEKVDDLLVSQLEDGFHHFDSSGNDWLSCPDFDSEGYGIGKIHCQDSSSLDWLCQNLQGFNTKSGIPISIWGWEKGLPNSVEFFVKDSFRLNMMTIAEGLLKYNKLRGKFGQVSRREIEQDGVPGFLYTMTCDDELKGHLQEKLMRLKYLSSSINVRLIDPVLHSSSLSLIHI